jgi:NAD(P)-dependent dehydrogenase (short-subunit alcohol dehydrogenase family)
MKISLHGAIPLHPLRPLYQALGSLLIVDSLRSADPALMLIDQRIAIIGGSSGIGLAVAQAAVDAGAQVTIGSSSKAKLQGATGAFTKRVEAWEIDVTNEESIHEFFDNLGEVNHVAITIGASYSPSLVVQSDLSESQKPFLVKYWGQFLVAKHAGPKLAAAGSITLTSGILSRSPSKNLAVQASVNAAVEALGRTLAIELAPRRANVVCPGFIDTGKLLVDIPSPQRAAQLLESKGSHLPVQRVGQPQDVAAAYLFAMENAYLTGQVLIVDGGSLMT